MAGLFSYTTEYLAWIPSLGNILQPGIISMQRSDSQRFCESAFIMITCKEYHDPSVLELLQSIPEVKEIQHVYGNYDVIVKVEADTADSMRDIIEHQIRKIPSIRSTTTLISSPLLSS